MMRILLFCRYPKLGQVKSRLAAKCGAQPALLLYKKMLTCLLQNLSPLSANIEIHYTGCTAQQAQEEWSLKQRHQVDGPLGNKLKSALVNAFERSREPVAFIGADCPFLEPSLFKHVESELKKTDVVIGPATDGGYYLIAMNAPYKELFNGIDWGSEKVCSQTQQIARENNLDVVLLDEKADMDYWDDIPEEWQQQVMEHNHEV